jgi:hypothetical protein
MATIHIGDSVKSIGGCAFQHCTALASIHLPNSVSSIGWYAFWGCDSLQWIHVSRWLGDQWCLGLGDGVEIRIDRRDLEKNLSAFQKAAMQMLKMDKLFLL